MRGFIKSIEVIIFIFSFLYGGTLLLYEHDLWRDEAFTAIVANYSPLEIVKVSFVDPTLPLHLLFSHYWTGMFGNSAIALRLISLFSFAIMCVFSYRLALRVFDKVNKAILIAILIIINPVLAYYATEARPYAMFTMFVIVATYYWDKLFEIRLNKLSVVMFIFCALGVLYTHALGIVFLGVLGGISIWRQIKLRKRIYWSVWTGLIIVVFGYLPWLSILLRQIQRQNRGFWLHFRPLDFKPLLAFFTNDNFIVNFFSIFLIILVAFGAGSLIFLSFLESKKQSYNNVYILVIGPLLLAFCYLLSFRNPVWYVRYLQFVLPFLIITFVDFTSHINKRLRFWLFTMLIVGQVLLFQVQIAPNPKLKTNFNPVREYFQDLGSEYIVLHPDIQSIFIFKYYLPEFTNLAYDPQNKAAYYLGKGALQSQDYLDGDLDQYKKIVVVAYWDNKLKSKLHSAGYKLTKSKQISDLNITVWQK